MRKIGQIIKPYLSITLGTLLLLTYLNTLRGQGSVLALGIIAIVIAAYYLTDGVFDILEALVSEKFGKAKPFFDVASVVAFPAFFFVEILINLIGGADAIGPTGWIINITSMVVALGLLIFFIASRFSKNATLNRGTLFFAGAFSLSLSFNLMFGFDGIPTALGDIILTLLFIYITYSLILFGTIIKVKGLPDTIIQDASDDEQPVQEPQQEEAPVEEAPVEEPEAKE